MDEFFLFIFGCSILFGIPGLLIWVLYRLHRRLVDVETQFVDLSKQLVEVHQRLDGVPVAAGVADETPVTAAGAPATEVAEAEVSTEPEPQVAPDVQPPPVEGTPHADAAHGVIADTPPAPAMARDLRVDSEVDSATESGEPPEPPEPTARPKKSEPWWSGLEETLWTRLPVWIGAVAIALAAAYLVKLSFDRGWIQPPVRVAFGVLGGVVLLVLGDRLRRSSAYVAQGLSASGIASLFVSFWAATSLYGLVPVPVGFGLLVLATATAVVLSLRQGYLIALLGLVGGFLTPALVSTGEPRPGVLFSYLLLLQIGLVIVSRKRGWGSLGLLTMLFGFLWVFAYLGRAFHADDAVWVGLFLVASVATFAAQVFGGVFSVSALDAPSWTGTRLGITVGWGSLAGGLVAGTALLAKAEHGNLEWAVLGLLALACMVVARFDRTYHGLAWLAVVLVTLNLSAFLGALRTGSSSLTSAALAAEQSRCLWIFSAFFVLLVGAAWKAAGPVLGRQPAYPGRWASLAAVVGVADLLLLSGSERAVGLVGFHWGILAVAVGALYVALAVPFARRRHQASVGVPAAGGSFAASADPGRALAALAVAATTSFSLAVPMELERQWLTVAWGLEVWALVWLAGRLQVRALSVFAWLMTALVAVRLLVNPAVLGYPIGTQVVFNWLLYGYGVPMVALVAASVLATRQGDDKLAEALQWTGLGLLVAHVTLQIRQYFFPGNLEAGDTLLLEWGTYIVAWSALAYGALELTVRRAELAALRPLRLGGRLLAALAVAAGALMLGITLNPLWSGEFVGEIPIFNRLLWSYGVPAVLLFLVRARVLAQGGKKLPALLSVVLLVDLFLLVTLEVRQFFRGGYLNDGAGSLAETYAYSISWIVLGLVLALVGARRSKALRWGSLCVLLPAVFKVFIVDTSNLDGLWRVFSLLGLGASLFGLAFFFQKFVFVGSKDDEDSPDGPESEDEDEDEDEDGETT